jgi:hypothetical protein
MKACLHCSGNSSKLVRFKEQKNIFLLLTPLAYRYFCRTPFKAGLLYGDYRFLKNRKIFFLHFKKAPA